MQCDEEKEVTNNQCLSDIGKNVASTHHQDECRNHWHGKINILFIGSKMLSNQELIERFKHAEESIPDPVDRQLPKRRGGYS